jgi:hypothetical protein
VRGSREAEGGLCAVAHTRRRASEDGRGRRIATPGLGRQRAFQGFGPPSGTNIIPVCVRNSLVRICTVRCLVLVLLSARVPHLAAMSALFDGFSTALAADARKMKMAEITLFAIGTNVEYMRLAAVDPRALISRLVQNGTC